MRSKKAFYGSITSLVYQVITVVCGLILPRLILVNFGSSYNGLTSSITQFLAGISLLKAGISGVAKAALFAPLARGDDNEISSIINATQCFMRRIAIIFAVFLLVFASLYPFLVSDHFDWIFSFTMVLILGISTFAQYYFGVTYSLLLDADQKTSVVNIIQIGTTLLNTLVAVILLLCGFGIHMVKLGSALVYALNPLAINLYVRRYYRIDKTVAPNNNLIKQRWDAFAQQVAFFVHNNTDVMVLTILSTIKEVSVYTVYNYIVINLRNFLVSIVNSFASAFGDMMAKGETKLAEENLKVYELIVFMSSSIFYSVAAVMIVPFVLLYTRNVVDANYNRRIFSILIIIAGAFSCYRIPYKTIVDAAGHFKQMRNGAIFEAATNITLSLLLVVPFGLIGVAIGTIVATAIRATQYAVYLSKTLIKRSRFRYIKHVALSMSIIMLASLFGQELLFIKINSFVNWILGAACTFCIVSLFTFGCYWMFYSKDMKMLYKKTKNMLRRKISNAH